MSSKELQEQAYRELAEKARLFIHGIRIEDDVLDKTGAGLNVKERSSYRAGEKLVPASFKTPAGFNVAIHRNQDSDYSLEYTDGRFVVARKNIPIFENVAFPERPKFYDKFTSDGKKMTEIVHLASNGCVAIWYSNVCNFQAHKETCLFCDIVSRPGNKFIKSASQIAESVKAAFDEGIAWRVDFTGGVIAERKEIDYYAEAIKAIRETVGQETVNSAACIAAPREFSNITRLHDSGFTVITLNIEMWDKNFFNALCPGKARTVGYEKWVEALKFAAREFGFGNVRCNFVAGIEPMERTLEGVDYLSSLGVVANCNIWEPGKGTALGGHRSPTPEWYLELNEKAADILRHNGITFEQATNIHPNTDWLYHDFWRIREERLPIFKAAQNREPS
ncbi:MAG: hypothetical protein LBU19_09060 [Treponema sp.]|jgi:hypothetical protein|nr:hypothetical protein [Treponema sp.]